MKPRHIIRAWRLGILGTYEAERMLWAFGASCVCQFHNIQRVAVTYRGW